MNTSNKQNGISVKAWRGDAMTLLAFDIDKKLNTPDFVGFTIGFTNPKGKLYYQTNRINFKGGLGYFPSDTAPFQKYRWLHVPGTIYEQFEKNLYGDYTYHIYARYWDAAKKDLKPLDDNLRVDVPVKVQPFSDGPVEVGYTRSFVTSQAFVNRFGKDAKVVPANISSLVWDTGKTFVKKDGKIITYEQAYEWMGFTARQKIIETLKEVLKTPGLTADMFTYDFNEPQIAKLSLELAAKGKARIISDNYITRSKDKKTGKVKEAGHGLPDAPETEFATLFNKKKKAPSDMVRGKFARYQHNKVIIVKKNGKPIKVLSGSTNFSMTGICVNANHVIVFNDAKIAKLYADYFDKSWTAVNTGSKFNKDAMAKKSHDFTTKDQASINITLSPHTEEYAGKILDGISDFVKRKTTSSVLFSVMQMSRSGGSVMPALHEVQDRENVFSYGVSDATDHVSLYKPGRKRGILVNAKQLIKELPPPLAQEPHLSAHNIHHKFVVVDFNKAAARVYLGSSNLALGGEQQNGDNLICIKDEDIATVFAIEAIRLVDHFHFRVNRANAAATKKPLKLDTTNKWTKAYYDEKDIKYVDRNLFK